METIRKFDLTRGSILKKLLLISLPIMGNQIMQMAYNLSDMFWLARVNSESVAASGTVGMYMWMSVAFLMFGRMGAEIGVSQNMGRGDEDEAKRYGQASFLIALVIGVFFGLVLILFRSPLIGFFAIPDKSVVEMSELYLTIVAIGIPFTFVWSACAGMFTGSGNSRLPFYINALSLLINMVLDPILILDGSFFANMGIMGAGISTIAGQIISCILGIIALKYDKHRPFKEIKLFCKPEKIHLSQIIRWGAPVAAESFLFTFLSMFITRFIASYGAAAITTQRIGSQIESLSWLIAGGYASALTAFIGQNFGAGKWARIHKSFRISTAAMGVWGVVVTLILLFGGRFLFAFFIPGDTEVIELGARFVTILAACQLIACLEAVAAGMFRGLGKTVYQSITSTGANAARVVLAYILMETDLGLIGIWVAVTVGAVVRGIWLYAWYLIKMRKQPRVDAA